MYQDFSYFTTWNKGLAGRLFPLCKQSGFEKIGAVIINN
jgi:hypothetical protein